jgi:hypothetical protein
MARGLRVENHHIGKAARGVMATAFGAYFFSWKTIKEHALAFAASTPVCLAARFGIGLLHNRETCVIVIAV